LKAGKRTVHRFSHNSELPAFQLDGTWQFRRSEPERWIDTNNNQYQPTNKGRR
jgi:hypothetical protein